MVKEFELDPQADSWVVLDLNMNARFERPYTVTGTEGAGYIPPSTEEYGVVIAASVSEYFINKDRSLGFITYCPQRTFLQPDRGFRQQGHILEALATARSEDEFSLKEFLALEDHHFTRGSTITIITADMSPDWMQEAYLMVRRGLRVAAVLMEPLSFGGEQTTEQAAMLLASEGVIPYVVRNGDDIGVALAVPVYNIR